MQFAGIGLQIVEFPFLWLVIAMDELVTFRSNAATWTHVLPLSPTAFISLRQLHALTRQAVVMRRLQKAIQAILVQATGLAGQKQWDEALAAVEQGLRVHQDRAELLEQVARIRDQMSADADVAAIEREIAKPDLDRAILMAETALKRRPGDARVAELLGRACDERARKGLEESPRKSEDPAIADDKDELAGREKPPLRGEPASTAGGGPGQNTRTGDDARVWDRNVQFTVYRPKDVVPEKWYDLLAFAHHSQRPLDKPNDYPDPVEEVHRQAKRILRDHAPAYQGLTQDSAQPIPREGEITFLPEVTNIEFNPSRRCFSWREGIHREEFRFRAGASLAGAVAKGHLWFFLGSIVIADVPLSIRVESASQRDSAGHISETASAYRRIFPSYSHKDVAIVEEFERYAVALGDEYLRDVMYLRSGRTMGRAADAVNRSGKCLPNCSGPRIRLRHHTSRTSGVTRLGLGVRTSFGPSIGKILFPKMQLPVFHLKSCVRFISIAFGRYTSLEWPNLRRPRAALSSSLDRRRWSLP